jgi:hypothetical protein
MIWPNLPLILNSGPSAAVKDAAYVLPLLGNCAENTRYALAVFIYWDYVAFVDDLKHDRG